jgi:hypothetical protein
MMNIRGIEAYAPQPIKQPYYKDDQINGLKAQESSYEAKIAQLESGDDEEENAAVLQETESRLAAVESQLDELKPVTAVKSKANAAPPPTDEEMNARFGAAYSVELSSAARMMDR